MTEGSAWPEIEALVMASPVPVRVLPVDAVRGEASRAELGVGVRSRLGAVVAHSGGLSVDHGWLRVLGGGTDRLPDVVTATREIGGSVVVGVDVLGGRFDWFPAESGAPPTVHWFAPDELAWIDLGLGYGAWLGAVLSGATVSFYADLRWSGWEAEVGGLAPDEGIATYPPPWTTEGKDLDAVTRRVVPLTELVAGHDDARRRLDAP